MANLFNKLFDLNKRELKRLEKIADQVEAFASQVEQLSDEDLQAKTEEFKKRFADGETVRVYST